MEFIKNKIFFYNKKIRKRKDNYANQVLLV